MKYSLRETLEKLFFASCLSCMRRALPRANLHISVYCACPPRPKVASVSSDTKALATLWKIWKGRVFFFFFSWMRESGTFERLSVFPERPIHFDDFLEQIRQSRNGRLVCHCVTGPDPSVLVMRLNFLAQTAIFGITYINRNYVITPPSTHPHLQDPQRWF